MSHRDRFNAEIYPDYDARGLLASFRALMAQRGEQIGADGGIRSLDEPAYTAPFYQQEPMGLIGRLQDLQQAQDSYRPTQPAMDLRRYELAQAITNVSRNLGINPRDLATAISYETGGTFNHNLWGGSGGNYLGLIQFGPNERAKYGVREGQSITEQMQAVEGFLRDRGVRYLQKRGVTTPMDLRDLYSTINTGSPGNYNLSDAKNGGAPGTVDDKVKAMGGHVANAERLLKQYDAARPRYSVPPPFPQHADPIFPGLPKSSSQPSLTGRRAGDPSSPMSSQANADIEGQEDHLGRPPLGLISGTPMQFWSIPIFDTRR